MSLSFDGRPVGPKPDYQTMYRDPNWQPLRGDQLSPDEWYERGLAESRRLRAQSAPMLGKAAEAAAIVIETPEARAIGAAGLYDMVDRAGADDQDQALEAEYADLLADDAAEEAGYPTEESHQYALANY